MNVELLDQLEQEHREAENLIGQIAQASSEARSSLIEQLAEALTRHMDLEEEQVYPMLRSLDPALGDDAQREHSETREALAALRAVADSPECERALAQLRSGLAHHIEEEESNALPQLRSQANLGADAR
jgi:hemerythrin-like domain-containing protein